MRVRKKIDFFHFFLYTLFALCSLFLRFLGERDEPFALALAYGIASAGLSPLTAAILFALPYLILPVNAIQADGRIHPILACACPSRLYPFRARAAVRLPLRKRRAPFSLRGKGACCRAHLPTFRDFFRSAQSVAQKILALPIAPQRSAF